jgi:hypothetical protein
MYHTLAVECKPNSMRPAFPYARGDEQGKEYEEDGGDSLFFEFDLVSPDVNSTQAQALDSNSDVISYQMLD